MFPNTTEIRAAIRRWWGLVYDDRTPVLATVAIGWLIILGMRFVVPAILPDVKGDLQIGNTMAGIAVSLLWVTYALMQFPSGIFIDRIGERSVIIGSLVVSGLGIVLFSVTPDVAAFLAACALFGLGTGLFGTPRVTIISRTYPENDGTALGLTFAAGSVGAALFPIAAAAISLRIGWRASFAVVLPLFALVMVGVLYVVPEGSDESAVDELSFHTVRRMKTALVRRPVLLAGGGMTIVVFSFQGLTAFLPIYLITEKGLAQSTAGLLYGLFFATGALIQPTAGYIADRYGDRNALVAITCLYTLGLLALPFATRIESLVALAVVLGTRSGIGPINNGYLVSVIPDDIRGAGYGLLRTTYMTVASTGSIAVGALSDAGWFDAAFLFLGTLTAVATVLYVVLPSRATA
nr:MFS transporter [Halorussus sp. JP-T4]